MSRQVYEVHAVKHGSWWLVTSPDAPGAVSQVRSVSQAEEHAREALAFVLGVPEDSFDISFVVELPAPLQSDVTAAKEAIAELAQLQQRTAELSRKAARRLVEAGLKGVEVAKVLDVSPQRVSQLIPAARAAQAKRSASVKATPAKRASGSARAAESVSKAASDKTASRKEGNRIALTGTYSASKNGAGRSTSRRSTSAT